MSCSTLLDATDAVSEHDANAEKDGHKPTARTLRRKRWWPFMLVPYMIGITWHGLHPFMSILTGDFSKPRRSYIDEHSLEPHHFKRDVTYHPIKASQHLQPAETSLCRLLRSGTLLQRSMECLQRKPLEIVRIVPVGTAVAPVSEALVLVVPATLNWRTSQLHTSVVQLVTKLASPTAIPWLAKTVLLVSASHTDTSLHETVDTFLNMVNGEPLLPLLPDGAVIRQLLVLDVAAATATPTNSSLATSTTAQLQILPQGRRGILPNMDLVFLCTSIYARDNLFTNIAMHPYRAQLDAWRQAKPLYKSLPPIVVTYLDKLLELLSFEYSLMAGPVTSHASALDRQIDALTLRLIVSSGRHDNNAVCHLIAGVEYILRAMSNLHERLHHSTSLYLLTSPRAYVKHEEYLVPNLLLLLPCVLRAITLVFCDLQRFDFAVAKRAMLYTLLWTVVVGMLGVPLLLGESDDGNDTKVFASWRFNVNRAAACLVALCHIPLFWWSPLATVHRDGKTNDAALTRDDDALLTVQFLACLLVVYTHVAIAFGHVSLAFPSALVWSMLAAFPRYDVTPRWIRKLLFVVTCAAGSWLLQNGVFSYDDMYMRFVCLPLHWLLSIIWLG